MSFKNLSDKLSMPAGLKPFKILNNFPGDVSKS